MDGKTTLNAGMGDDKMNHKHQCILSNNKKDIGGDDHDVKDLPNNKPPTDGNSEGPMNSNLMTWTKMLESLDEISSSIGEMDTNPDLGDESFDDGYSSDTGMGNDPGPGDEDLLNDLNEIFTPILVMQNLTGDISDQIQEAFSDASILLEKNIIQFDDSTRMAQLISVCALLIARKKNSHEYQMYKKASDVRKAMKLNIQKSEYAAAQALAQKFLVKVSTTNNSSVARNAANDLLPETQH